MSTLIQAYSRLERCESNYRADSNTFTLYALNRAKAIVNALGKGI